MTYTQSRKQQAKILRVFRKVHRITGAFLFAFFFIIGVTGIILGWKTHSNGLVLPETQKGTSYNLEEWKSLVELEQKAFHFLQDSISNELSLELDRIDVRKEKGIVKFVFEQHLWEVQLDGKTGALLQLDKRHSDFIENLHDGSVIDNLFGFSSKIFKVIYTSIMGLSLLLFTITGFWLWYGPKRMKRRKMEV